MEYLLNLAVFILPLILFCFWGVIELAVFSICRTPLNHLQHWLLAPILGAAFHYGFHQLPNVKQMLSGREYSQCLWFLCASGMSRSGSDLLLAWLSSISRANPLQLLMPLIVSFNLLVVSAAGALAANNKLNYKLPLLGSLLVTI